MKKLSIIIAMLVGMVSALAQTSMQAVFSYSTFYLPDDQAAYMETHLSFDAWTLQYQQTEAGPFQATVEVSILVHSGDYTIFAKKYNLNSPAVGDTSQLQFSFIDVQRFAMPNGIYTIDLSLRDINSPDSSAKVSEKVLINYDNEHPTISSIIPIASATKTKKETMLSRNGYDMQPYVSDFYPQNIDKINIYYEIYNIQKEIGFNSFTAKEYIEEAQTGRVMTKYEHKTKKHSSSSIPIYSSIDISDLPSGNYNIVIDLRNSKDQSMLIKRHGFYRSNPNVKVSSLGDYKGTFAAKYNNEEQLNLYLDGMFHIASDIERGIIKDLLKRSALDEKQEFLYTFWVTRNALNPEKDWLEYKERIEHVQAAFSYPKTPGIHTDRGRVYLQYGPPDFVRDEKNYVSANRIGSNNEGTEQINPMVLGNVNPIEEVFTNAGNSQGHIHYLPYQLWRYNKLDTDDPNRVFLFWDEHRSGYYKLLNSNARGEVQEPGWERRLCRNQLKEDVVGEVGEQFNRGY